MITSPLYDHVHAGSLDKVRFWLDERPQDLNTFVSDGYTPLQVACMFGQEQVVRFLLDRFVLVNTISDNTARTTALHLAVAFRDEDVAVRIVNALVANGAELNAKQTGGETPLHHAVARGSLKLVDELILSGADPFLKDEQGKSATELARELSGAGPSEEIRTALKRAFSLPLE